MSPIRLIAGVILPLTLVGCFSEVGNLVAPGPSGGARGDGVVYRATDGRTQVTLDGCSDFTGAEVATTDPSMARNGPQLASLTRALAPAIQARCGHVGNVMLRGTLDGYMAFYARTGADFGWQLAEFQDIETLNARNAEITRRHAAELRAQGGAGAASGGDACGYGSVMATHPGAAQLDVLLGGATRRACEEDRRALEERARRRSASTGGSCPLPREIVHCLRTVNLLGDDLMNREITMCAGQRVDVFNVAMQRCRDREGWCDIRNGRTYASEEEAAQANC